MSEEISKPVQKPEASAEVDERGFPLDIAGRIKGSLEGLPDTSSPEWGAQHKQLMEDLEAMQDREQVEKEKSDASRI